MTNTCHGSDSVPPPSSDEQRIDYDTYLDERRTLFSSEIDVAARFDKSVLTLSGGALLLSMTFVKDIASKPDRTWTLFASWLCLAVAVTSMLISLLSSQSALRCQREILNHSLQREALKPSPNWFAGMTHWLNVASLAAFIAGLVFLSVFIYVNMPGE